MNSSNYTAAMSSEEETTWTLFLTVIESIICLTILVGNGLVIAAYIRVKKLRNLLTYFFLIHLTIADLLVGVSAPVKLITRFLPEYWTNNYRCVLQFSSVGKSNLLGFQY